LLAADSDETDAIMIVRTAIRMASVGFMHSRLQCTDVSEYILFGFNV
jgi:hypothetical protein